MTLPCHIDIGVSQMAFTIPSFPILCNVFDGPVWPAPLRIADLPCNLAIGRRVQIDGFDRGSSPGLGMAPTLLVPALSDLRDESCSTDADLVEVPAGSGRVYLVCCVDDFGKGFPNEHRAAALTKACAFVDPSRYPGLFWPVPIP